MSTTRGIDIFDAEPGLYEDMPRGDRRGTRNHAQEVRVMHERWQQQQQRQRAPPRRTYRPIRGARWTAETHVEIDEELRRLEVSALSRSTISAYGTAFKHWAAFMYNEYGEEQPYLTGDDPREDEKKMVRFIAWQSSLGRV